MLSQVLGAPRTGIRALFPKPLHGALLPGSLHNAAFPCKQLSLPGISAPIKDGPLVTSQAGWLGGTPALCPLPQKVQCSFSELLEYHQLWRHRGQGQGLAHLSPGHGHAFLLFPPRSPFATLKKCTVRAVHPAHGLQTTVIAFCWRNVFFPIL